MIRVVVEVEPTIYTLGICDEAAVTPTFVHQGTTYYLCERRARWVRYKPALSGWGAATDHPTFDPRQR